MRNISADKTVSLSSWNYGSFSLFNPYYDILYSNLSRPAKIYQNDNLQKNDERIVKNEFFENFYYMKYIKRNNEIKIKRVKNTKNNHNNEFQITFNKWRKEKNKKIREEKLENMKKEKGKNIPLNIGISYKEWYKKKEIEKIKKNRKNKLVNQLKYEKGKKQREEENKINFKNWIIKKEKEKEKNKLEQEKKLKEEKEKQKQKKNYLKRKNTEVIGPYSFAKILRNIQNSDNNEEI